MARKGGSYRKDDKGKSVLVARTKAVTLPRARPARPVERPAAPVTTDAPARQGKSPAGKPKAETAKE